MITNETERLEREKQLELAASRNNLCLRCKNAVKKNFETGKFDCNSKRKCENHMYFQLDKKVVYFMPNNAGL